MTSNTKKASKPNTSSSRSQLTARVTILKVKSLVLRLLLLKSISQMAKASKDKVKSSQMIILPVNSLVRLESRRPVHTPLQLSQMMDQDCGLMESLSLITGVSMATE
jgi:hypothetical protein